MNCDEAQELITALVDQELDQAERSALEAHLEECSGCRLAFEEELALKQKIRQAGERMHAPALLRSRILSDRRIFTEKSRSARQWLGDLWPGSPIFRTALALTVLVLLDSTNVLFVESSLSARRFGRFGNLRFIRARRTASWTGRETAMKLSGS